jgi:predicted MFS family arabinose efflux permease
VTTQHLTRRAVLLLALACGVAVGTVYFPQAISPLVASGLHVPPDSAALVVTATQLGYAAGIFLLVPLGDRFPHRPLISAVWTGVALLLTGPTYHLGAPAVGALALIGAATMFCTPIAGRQADRHGPDPVDLVTMIAALASAAILLIATTGGAMGIAALIVGALVLDVAMQSGMVANQVRIFALRPEVRSRLNTAYMTCAYLGGSIGSWLAVNAYAHFAWPGVCALLALLTGAALARHLMRRTTAGVR